MKCLNKGDAFALADRILEVISTKPANDHRIEIAILLLQTVVDSMDEKILEAEEREDADAAAIEAELEKQTAHDPLAAEFLTALAIANGRRRR